MKSPPALILLLLVCAALAGLLLPPMTPTLRSAPAPSSSASNPPGTREVYEGTVCEYRGDDTNGSPAPAARAGSMVLEVVDGAVTGRLTFRTPDGDGITGVHGYLDPATSRGFLKLDDAPDADGSREKLALLLRRGVLTGGTMDADGRVLAFRLERFLVVMP